MYSCRDGQVFDKWITAPVLERHWGIDLNGLFWMFVTLEIYAHVVSFYIFWRHVLLLFWQYC